MLSRSGWLLSRDSKAIAILLLALTCASAALAQDDYLPNWTIGMTGQRVPITARAVLAEQGAAAVIAVIAGLNGEDEFSARADAVFEEYASRAPADRPISLITVPVANPQQDSLQFPPEGNAFADNPVSHALWRWLGSQGPDLVIIDGGEDSGLATALTNFEVATVGSIPVARSSVAELTLPLLSSLADQSRSAAGLELDRRRSRSPRQLAEQLAGSYGQEFSSPVYVPGMSLIGRMRLGQIDQVETLLASYLDGADFEVTNSSLLAGQLVFAEHAERTAHPGSLALLERAARLAFDEGGELRPVMPLNNEMSDAFFMATPLLVKAGNLLDDDRYFDMAAAHVGYMRRLLLQGSGLYRHSPEADVAWSRGNGFPAIGLALSLSDFPPDHPARDVLLGVFVHHLEALLPFQDFDGMWRQVIDQPGSFPEITSTAMIGWAIKRGIDRGWLPAGRYQPVLDRAWQAVNSRTGADGRVINACTSTGKMPSLQAYLDRTAILGRDDRAGGMIMNFALEMAGVR